MLKMLKKKDLMKRWGVSKRTIERWMKSGKIPYIKSPVNNRVYFDEEEIERWESKMKVGRYD